MNIITGLVDKVTYNQVASLDLNEFKLSDSDKVTSFP